MSESKTDKSLQFKYNDDNTYPTLEKVRPNKTTLITSCPCEKQAAHNRNESVEAMNMGNAGAVKYRYLQSTKGKSYSFFEAGFTGSTSILCFALIFSINQAFIDMYSEASANGNHDQRDIDTFKKCIYGVMLFLITMAMIPTVNTVINIRNARRYNETKEGCEKWLERKVGMNALDQIKKLNYSDYHELKPKYGKQGRLGRDPAF